MTKKSTKHKIIAVATGKGGAGKSTIALMLAGTLAERGEKTLFVDLDPEGHSTWGIGGDLDTPGTAAMLLDAKYEIQQVHENFDLLAGNRDLESPEIGRLDNEALFDVLSVLDYDRIIIDCPGNTFSLQRLGIVASNTTLIPVTSHPFSMQNANLVLDDLQSRKNKKRRGANDWAIVVNMYSEGRILEKNLIEQLEEEYDDVPYFIVHRHEVLAQATAAQLQITSGLLGKNKEPVNALLKWLKA